MLYRERAGRIKRQQTFRHRTAIQRFSSIYVLGCKRPLQHWVVYSRSKIQGEEANREAFLLSIPVE